MSEADGWGGLRTVCHGCRTMREVVEQVATHRFEVRAMIVPGDGTVFRRVRASFETADVVVEIPCPDCSVRPAAVLADPDDEPDTADPDAGPDAGLDDGSDGDSDWDSDEDPDEDPDWDPDDDEDTPEWLLPGFVPPA
jgi:hypothetical protein